MTALAATATPVPAGTGVSLIVGWSRSESGQALLLVLGGLLAIVLLAVAGGAVAAGLGERADQQRAADLAALAAARAMSADYAQVDVWSARAGAPRGPGTLDRATYLARARGRALATARRNGARDVRVGFPSSAGASPAGGALDVPVRVAVTVTDDVRALGVRVAAGARAEAELVPPAAAALPPGAGGAGEYSGPLAYRDGKPMRPDVALAYDRMRAAARADGIALVVVSGYRSDAEQAVLFARRPDPKWVAPPGQSLHRLGTELDIGPRSAYGWLGRHGPRFGFTQRYSWEPWHWGYTRNAGSASVGYGGRGRATRTVAGGDRSGSSRSARSGGDGASGTSLPDWVPSRYRPLLARAAQRWNVGAVLLAAQLRVESGFDPGARSSAGALGIAQFMPGTARQYGLRDPFDPAAAIDAQAHLMRDLLRRFGSVPLALAAYNAGPQPVQQCGCPGPYGETRRYVATILALILGHGDVAGLGAAGMPVRLVR